MFADMFCHLNNQLQSINNCRVKYAETLIALGKVKLWKTKTKHTSVGAMFSVKCVFSISIGNVISSEANNHLNKSTKNFKASFLI